MDGAGMRQRIKKFYDFKIRTKKTGEKTEVMRYVWPAVLLFFLIGIIGANLINREQLSGYGIWSTYFIDKFKYARIQSAELFYYVLEARFPVLLLLFLLIISNWGTVAGIVFLSWQSFTAGFLMAAAVIAYGLKGILLMGMAAFPQYLLYFPIYIAYIYLASFWRGKIKGNSGESKAAGKKEYILFLGLCGVLLGLYITGIFLESYVNPYLLKKILKFF